MKEAAYPVDKEGKPDLGYYKDSASYYADMHAQAMQASQRGGFNARKAFSRRVHACWGLIARGGESIPFALKMLTSGDGDAREDGAAILAEVGKDGIVVERLLDALAVESDIQARDGIILALGSLRNRAALHPIAMLIENEATDSDSRWTAVEALGKIVRRRFLSQPDPVSAALDWIANARRRGSI